MLRLLTAVVVVAAALSSPAPVFAAGQDTVVQAVLKASDPAQSADFGSAVALSGDTLVVGSPGVGPADNTGAVYVFTRTGSTWAEQAKLTAPDAATGDVFGARVDVSGNTLVVGAFRDDDAGTSSGSAYVFNRSGGVWAFVTKLVASDASTDDQFGAAVAVTDGEDTIVVGTSQSFGPGSAYVFSRTGSTWTETARLSASDASAGDRFGTGLSVSGDTIVVGAQFAAGAQNFVGAVYVFTRVGGSWTEQAKLASSKPEPFAGFGKSVAIEGDLVVVGASLEGEFPAQRGAAYVFQRTGTSWVEQTRLTASVPRSAEQFGLSVDISGSTIVVSSLEDLVFSSSSGRVFVFTPSGTTWAVRAILVSPGSNQRDDFGVDVAVLGGTVVVGAPNAGEFGGPTPFSGAVHVFVDPFVNTYWMLEADGTIYSFGDSLPPDPAALPPGVSAVAFDRTSDGEGLWVLDSAGTIHTRGTAGHFGDVNLSDIAATDTVATISATPSGLGYWVFTELGQTLAFGDATHVGDLTTMAITPNDPIVGSVSTPSGNGYWMVGADGGIFAFGDTTFHGSIPQVLPAGALSCDIAGLVPTPSGDGYWMVGCDGGVFAFGDAPFRGSIPGSLPAGTRLNAPVNGLVPYGNGYLMVASDGGVFTFSDRQFLGSLGNQPPNTDIVAITAFTS